MKLRNIFTSLALIAFCSMGALAQSGKQTGPQLVRDIDRPERQYFNKVATSSIILPTVPAGKVLVIESINGKAVTDGTVAPLYLLAWDDLAAEVRAMRFVAPSFHNSTTKTSFYSYEGKVYIPSGSNVSIWWFNNGASMPSDLSVNVSGYYVDVP